MIDVREKVDPKELMKAFDAIYCNVTNIGDRNAGYITWDDLKAEIQSEFDGIELPQLKEKQKFLTDRYDSELPEYFLNQDFFNELFQAITDKMQTEERLEFYTDCMKDSRHGPVAEMLTSRVTREEDVYELIDRLPNFDIQDRGLNDTISMGLEKQIPQLDNVEQEIERLQKCTKPNLKNAFFNMTSREGRIRWIQMNPEKFSTLSRDEQRECFSRTEDKYAKTKMLMTQEGVLARTDSIKEYYPQIQDKFLQMKLTEANGICEVYHGQERAQHLQELNEKIDEYKSVCHNLEEYDNEQDIANFIENLEDNDMKIAMLDKVKEKNSRERIINSLTRNVGEDIQELDGTAQCMIVEIFQDAYGGEIPQDKKERLMIELNRNDVSYGELQPGENGRASHVGSKIILNEERKGDDKANIGFLIHEYAHRLSMSDYKENPYISGHTFEEGNADLFADLVINHYLEKHGKEDLDFDIGDGPYQVESSYDFQNAWARTMLYPLSKDGRDTEAISEYLLGSKEKYFEMTTSPEIVEQLNRDSLGNIHKAEIETRQLYESHAGQYAEPDRDSIYLKRNKLVTQFIDRDEKSMAITRETVKTFAKEPEVQLEHEDARSAMNGLMREQQMERGSAVQGNDR